ncbi:hypothetical protein HDU86_003615 [Geranomyces michiganensis]|nr:hypothetical protein HDU86_003615 [Geranomyces michiganensis]
MRVTLSLLLVGPALMSMVSAFPFFHLRRRAPTLDPSWQTGSGGSSCNPDKDLFACDGKLFLVCKGKENNWSWSTQRKCDSNCMDEITTKPLCYHNSASGWTPDSPDNWTPDQSTDDSTGGPAVTRESGGDQWATTKPADNEWASTKPGDSAAYTQPPTYETQTLPYCQAYTTEATSTYAQGYNPGTYAPPEQTAEPWYGNGSPPPSGYTKRGARHVYSSTKPADYNQYTTSTAPGYYVQTCIPYPTSTSTYDEGYQQATTAVATETPYEAPRYAGNSCVEPSVVWCQDYAMLVCSDNYKWTKKGSCDCDDQKWANACP